MAGQRSFALFLSVRIVALPYKLIYSELEKLQKNSCTRLSRSISWFLVLPLRLKNQMHPSSSTFLVDIGLVVNGSLVSIVVNKQVSAFSANSFILVLASFRL